MFCDDLEVTITSPLG